MHRLNYILMFVLIGYLTSKAANDSVNVSLNGQFTTWAVGQVENPYGLQVGGRFVPALLGEFKLSNQSKIDFESSLNINGSASFTNFNYDTIAGQLNPYRIWFRYSSLNWEIRAGLQQINFGQAKMFRPLMWFDAMDVRDPLKLTNGVYGILGKYYFENNANIWAWGLIGNKNTKGYELFASKQWKPEIGGRYQTPFGPGEIALSTNFRKIEIVNWASSIPNNDYLLNESRVGLDGKWDLGIGLWFESSLAYINKKNYSIPTVSKMQDMWNLGADYTLSIGNGVGVTLEYFRYHMGDQLLFKGNAINIVGSMLTYPISIVDNLSAMLFYLPGSNATFNYVSWNRLYDNWGLYVFGFWNPEKTLAISQAETTNLFSGKGLQIMLNYNF